MRYQVSDGTVTLGGKPVLNHINFEIKGNEKIAVVGKNGSGKTTLLRLLAGQISLDRDDKRMGAGILFSRQTTVAMLDQQAFAPEEDRTVEEILLEGQEGEDLFSRERFEYEREFDILFTGLKFVKEDKKRKVSDFSGGEQTKIRLLRLLLNKPDILLLDEPTNHLDLDTVSWLEGYLKSYPGAVIMVSHDRFFLDETAEIVYELSEGRLTRYVGNYSGYRSQKRKNLVLLQKAYDRQQEERKNLESLIERFKHKPTKAAFARSRKKMLERLPKAEKPETYDVPMPVGDLTPEILGSKWVFEAEHLKLGYEKPLVELSLRIRRGQKIAVIGPNGSGKTTFLKTVAGFLPPLGGEASLGNHITLGYFDQLSSGIRSESTVAEHFREQFPSLSEKDLRNTLAAYLFGGSQAQKTVSSLSGGEKSRLVLAELLQSRPNFLVLDEPTNHMDLQAKETLEQAFLAYTGTMLFVSHDRYLISQVADSLLIFEGHSVMYYPFSYRHYTERLLKAAYKEEPAGVMKAEEQALISGLRSVPKAERHRLREQPTEEAYLDWQLRLAKEQMDLAEEQVKIWGQRLAEFQEEWKQSQAYWQGEYGESPETCETLLEKYGEMMENWTCQCLKWYEIHEKR